jgi:hypothetical protein
LSRLREEVLRLVIHCTNQIKIPAQKDEYLTAIFGIIVNDLAVRKNNAKYVKVLITLQKHGSLNTHQKAQVELSFWRYKETELRSRAIRGLA